MIDSMLQDPEYLKARANNEWYFWPQAGLTSPSWEELLENVAWACMNPLNSSKVLKNFSFVSYRADRIPLVKEILKRVAQEQLSDSFSAHLFFSMSTESQNYGRHEDDSDLWYWQMYGRTHWTIEHPDGSKVERMMEPGDWLYCPRHYYHTAVPQGARASLSFAQHYNIPRKPNKAF